MQTRRHKQKDNDFNRSFIKKRKDVMMHYYNLVKISVDKNGEQDPICAFDSTEICSKDCYNCKVFKGILTQLNAFEEIANSVK